MSLEPVTKKLIETAIKSLSDKQIGLLEQWINNWTFYIEKEAKFQPHRNIKYNAGDIVTVCFGYNVGSEQGGNRPAVVIEDNNLSDKTVMIVPLASIHPESKGRTISNSNVYLGELREFNVAANKEEGTETKALVNQMRAISKLRIIQPSKPHHKVIRLGNDNLKMYCVIIHLEIKNSGFKAHKKDFDK
ncbi:type II toxin-antitoxin system PemK/MazF family toxin [Enterococcus faecalis]|nr:type II toxin-antitoxin system PemK/MazF family toxin [Enterococcus faecalis]